MGLPTATLTLRSVKEGKRTYQSYWFEPNHHERGHAVAVKDVSKFIQENRQRYDIEVLDQKGKLINHELIPVDIRETWDSPITFLDFLELIQNSGAYAQGGSGTSIYHLDTRDLLQALTDKVIEKTKNRYR